MPYAIGAKFGHPDRAAIAFVGEGAMQMNGMAELITIARYWQEWTNPTLVVAVLHNNHLNQVTWEMRAMEGDPKLVSTQTLPDLSYAAFAELIGLEAISVDRAEDIGRAWGRALSAGRPALLDVRCDPDVPPIPPHATWEQMTDTAKAVLKGDEDSWGFIKQRTKNKLQEFLPHRV